VFPRITISPMVTPSAGTSTGRSGSPEVATTLASSAVTIPTPCLDFSRERSATGNAGQESCSSQTVYGPYVSVSP